MTLNYAPTQTGTLAPTAGLATDSSQYPQPTTIATPHDFAVALLYRLGITPNPGNVLAVEAWALAEGGHWRNTALYNPLNTTQRAPGSTSMNSVGVQQYTSWQEGLDATAQTLQNGLYNGVLQALAGSDPYAVAGAVGRSPWGTGNFSADVASAGGYAPVSVGGGTINLVANDVNYHVPGVLGGPGFNIPFIGGGGCK